MRRPAVSVAPASGHAAAHPDTAEPVCASGHSPTDRRSGLAASPRPGLCACLAALLLAAPAAKPLAQTLPPASPLTPTRLAEPELLALLLTNFVRYTQWPELANARPQLLVCSVDVAVGGLDRATLAGKQAWGKPIAHRAVSGIGDTDECQLLFIAAGARRRIPGLLAAHAGRAVLTVSDAPGFLDTGGMLQLERVDARYRFDVNLPALRAAGLQLPPGVLQLARQVVGAEARP